MSLETIRERLEAATPGPWKHYGIAGVGVNSAGHPDIIWEGHERCQGCGEEWDAGGCLTMDDADLIAHAPTDLKLLLAVAKAAKRLEKLFGYWEDRPRELADSLQDALDALEAAP